MSKLEIINATIEDIPLIRQLTAEIWPETYTSIIGSAQIDYMLNLFYTPEELQKQMQESGHRFIICHYDQKPVAFASWSEIEKGIYKLHKIYVLPSMQGTGIGRYMIADIVNETKARGAIELRLNVNRYNHPALRFYEKTGFIHLKDEDIDIGNGYFMNDYVLSLGI